MKNFFSLQTRPKKLEARGFDLEAITSRQEKVPGFRQDIMNNLKVLLIGAGGLGGEIAQGLARKGVAGLSIFDGDSVEPSNLSRQRFYPRNLYKNKAICLAKNLMQECINRTEIIAYPYMFQRAIEENIEIKCDIVICAPDNNAVRIFTAKYFLDKVPVIFTGLDEQANTGYVFIQEPGKACFGCAFPSALTNKRQPCPNTPAIIDLLKIISGFALFSIDSTLMQRKRNWNYRQIFLCGFVPDAVRQVEKKQSCGICSKK